MFDHLLESSRWDDSNKSSNIEIGEEIGILEIKIRTLSGALSLKITWSDFDISACDGLEEVYISTIPISSGPCSQKKQKWGSGSGSNW